MSVYVCANLCVIRSHRNNRYLLVIMDYFTKWAEAVPLPDQKATSITKTIINLCSSFGTFILTKAGILKIAYFGKCSHALLHTTHKGWHGWVFQSVTFIVTWLLYSAWRCLGTVFVTGAMCILYGPTLINKHFPLSAYVWQTSQVCISPAFHWFRSKLLFYTVTTQVSIISRFSTYKHC